MLCSLCPITRELELSSQRVAKGATRGGTKLAEASFEERAVTRASVLIIILTLLLFPEPSLID